MENIKGMTGLVEIDTNVLSKVDEMKMEVAQSDFTELYTNTLSENTKRAYMSTIKEFFGVYDVHDIKITEIQSVTPEIANLWAKQQYDAGMSPSTINRKLSAMQNFYKFLCRRSIKIAEYNPFDTNEGCVRFKNASKDYTEKRILEPHEINKMFTEARKDDSIIGTRNLLVLQLLATTGMRRAEVCSIKLGDIQKTNGKHIINIVGKGDKHRVVVLTDGIYELVKQYVHERGVTMLDKELPLIVSHSTNADPAAHVNTMTIYRIVKKYADYAGIDPDTISPHCMRASYATLAYNELGMSVDEIQDLMGHSSHNTTKIYIKTSKMLDKNPADKLASMFE